MTQPNYGGEDDPPRLWTSPEQQFSFVVRGLRLKLPDGTSEWTRNAAAVRHWVLTNRRGVAESDIHAATYDTSFDISNQPVTNSLPQAHQTLSLIHI